VVQQPGTPDGWPGPVFRSRDGGATWEKFDLGLVGSGGWTPWRLLFDLRAPDTLYVSTWYTPNGWTFGTELYRSTDGGATWQRIWEPNDDPAGVDVSTSIAIYPAPGGGLHAVTGSGLFKWVLESE
jgi:photosystem II stability/assembly factor-like uncharacterized protein